MEIKEIYVEIKKSKNFQTYTCGELITIDAPEDIEHIRKESQARCRKAVLNQMKLDLK